jgi:hypothetical protein
LYYSSSFFYALKEIFFLQGVILEENMDSAQ